MTTMTDEVIYADFGGDEIETCVENHPAGKGVSERDRALLDAAKWSNRIDVARMGYGQALHRCRALGLSDRVIAEAVGKTPAAIRMHFGRKKKK